MPYNYQADVVCLLAEQYDTKSTGFDPSFKRPACLATLKSYDTKNQSVDINIYIYIYIYIYILIELIYYIKFYSF